MNYCTVCSFCLNSVSISQLMPLYALLLHQSSIWFSRVWANLGLAMELGSGELPIFNHGYVTCRWCGSYRGSNSKSWLLKSVQNRVKKFRFKIGIEIVLLKSWLRFFLIEIEINISDLISIKKQWNLRIFFLAKIRIGIDF